MLIVQAPIHLSDIGIIAARTGTACMHWLAGPNTCKAPRAANVMPGRHVPKQVRVIALLVWFLSGKSDLAMSYVLSRGKEYDLDNVDLMSAAHVALYIVQWLRDASVISAVHTGLAELRDPLRIAADQYLMHSLLIEFIMTQNQKGVAVDLVTAIAKYIRLWSMRPITDKVKQRLARLVWHRNTRRRFGVNLRREWALCFNTFSDSREPTSDQIRRKARTCSRTLQIMHHVLQVCIFI